MNSLFLLPVFILLAATSGTALWLGFFIWLGGKGFRASDWRW